MSRLTIFMTFAIALSAACSSAEEQLKALIIDGQNNHADWPKTTAMMKRYLEESERFTVDVCRTKYLWKGEKLIGDFALGDGIQREMLDKPRTDPNFKPDFKSYDVVISNFGWQTADWPKETQAALVDYMKSGGGLVVIHAADNAFPGWHDFNLMIGLGGWGGRNEKSGPYVYVDEEGETVRDESKGPGGGHGPQREFQVVIRDPDHPITSGMPRAWMHSRDELYEKLRGPAENMTVLATSYADPSHGGGGRHEPMAMTITFGEGRVFHSPLGHAGYSMECVGFRTLLLRGTEWAATGEVTIEIPDDFPTADKTSHRTYEIPAQAATN